MSVKGAKLITLEDVEEAYARIHSYVKKTPILTSSNLNALAGKSLHFKCENFQSTGSFKVRGAMNSLLLAIEKHGGNLEGVLTESSGNHGQALAWAAAKFRIRCLVVVPKGAPIAKLKAIEHYGGELVLCDNSMTARQAELARLTKEYENYEVIHPHNFFNTIAGQGTIALEFLEQAPMLEAIIVSIGGGGLSAGVGAYVKGKAPNVKGKSLQRQLESGVLEDKHGNMLQTMADGIRVDQVGSNAFPSVEKFCEHTVFTLEEDEIAHATKLIWERLKVVIEPSAALPLAAVLKYKEELKNFHEIGLLLCGGNMNLDKLL